MDLLEQFDAAFRTHTLPLIREFLPDDFSAEPIYYYLDIAINRKFRSGLPVIVAENEGFDIDAAALVGAFSELFFCAALVIDDIVDRDSRRENGESAHIRFGVERTVSSTHIALAACHCMAARLLELELRDSVTKTMHDMLIQSSHRVLRTFGLDLETQNRTRGTQCLIEDAAEKTNTGAYALATMGPIAEQKGVIGATETLVAFGTCLGIAGQLRNDVYDFALYSNWRGRLSDLSNGYDTFPIAMIRELLGDHAVANDVDPFDIQESFRNSGAQERTFDIINQQVDRACTLVGRLGLSEDSTKMLNSWAEQHRPPELFKRDY